MLGHIAQCFFYRRKFVSWPAVLAAVVAASLPLLIACQQAQSAAPAKGATATPAPIATRSSDVTNQPQQKRWQSPPAMAIDPDKKNYTATIETTLGTIKVDLFAKDAPKTANNFVFLAREGFYDGTIFHRIIKDFMIQGGDPLGTGTGSPGYKFDDELPVKRSYEPGIVAMANSGRNTQGSQFFIVNGPQGQGLDRQPNYTQFGKVSAGMDIVQRISSVPVELNPMSGEVSKPKDPPKIKSITITETDQ